MPDHCSSFGCTNRRSHGLKEKGVTFHRFPADIETRKAWENAVGRPQFTPSKTSVLCNEHFKEEDFDRSGNIVRLKKGVLPRAPSILSSQSTEVCLPLPPLMSVPYSCSDEPDDRIATAWQSCQSNISVSAYTDSINELKLCSKTSSKVKTFSEAVLKTKDLAAHQPNLLKPQKAFIHDRDTNIQQPLPFSDEHSSDKRTRSLSGLPHTFQELPKDAFKKHRQALPGKEHPEDSEHGSKDENHNVEEQSVEAHYTYMTKHGERVSVYLRGQGASRELVIHNRVGNVAIHRENGWRSLLIKGFQNVKEKEQPIDIMGLQPENIAPEVCQFILQSRPRTYQYGIKRDDIDGKATVFALGRFVMNLYTSSNRIVQKRFTDGKADYNGYSDQERKDLRFKILEKIAKDDFLTTLLPKECSPPMMELLLKMLAFSPKERITIREALRLIGTFDKDPPMPEIIPVTEMQDRQKRKATENGLCMNKKRRKQASPHQPMPSCNSQRSLESISNHPTPGCDSQMYREGRPEQPNHSCASQRSKTIPDTVEKDEDAHSGVASEISKDTVIVEDHIICEDNIEETASTTITTNTPSSEIESIYKLWNLPQDYDVLVAKVYGSTVTDTDIRSLKEDGWLTDNVIDTYLKLLVHELADLGVRKIMHLVSSTMETLIRGAKNHRPIYALDSYTFVVGAYHRFSHWTLVVLDLEKKVVFFYNPVGETEAEMDSIRLAMCEFISRCSNAAESDIRSQWRAETMAHASQTDTFNCGVYCLMFAECHLKGTFKEMETITRQHLAATRLSVATKLLTFKHYLIDSCPKCGFGVDEAEQKLQCATCGRDFHFKPFCVEDDLAIIEDGEQFSCKLCRIGFWTYTRREKGWDPNAYQWIDKIKTLEDLHCLKQVEEDVVVTENAAASLPCSIVEAIVLPEKRLKRKKQRSSFVYTNKLKRSNAKKTFCVCQKPDDRRLYWQCDECEGWFHPGCVGEDIDHEPDSYVCHGCQNKVQGILNVKEAKARQITDRLRYLNRSENLYTVSEADIERLGCRSLEQCIEETDEGWFDVQEKTPLSPDCLGRSAPLVQSPMTLPLRPVASSNIASRLCTTSPLTSDWSVSSSVTAPIYKPTPKAACPKFALQAVSVAISTTATPGTHVQDEPVLHLDDFNVDFLEEEPLVPLVTTASQEVWHTPAKQARLSPISPANACNEEPKRSKGETADAAESEKLQILRNTQKMASDMTSGVEPIAREMSRQNRLLDKQTDLYRITNGVLQIRDDLNQKKSRKENRPPEDCGKICKEMTFSEYS
ncbi:uncharacterized protein LOC127866837 isoform X3 [Dreissena polymorpha]|uniref:uncharacterized protein LOC127866837 isoform X3 n=1 Tax=Dreissena polymorpha TaxID=45954 RepID=UPI002263F0AF|nr:uncharacterized protein LOC127866837 isoform X3 [Dreissena polymorpha]